MPIISERGTPVVYRNNYGKRCIYRFSFTAHSATIKSQNKYCRIFLHITVICHRNIENARNSKNQGRYFEFILTYSIFCDIIFIQTQHIPKKPLINSTGTFPTPLFLCAPGRKSRCTSSTAGVFIRRKQKSSHWICTILFNHCFPKSRNSKS